MSANKLKQLTQEQRKQIQDVLGELSDASISLDPQRIEDAKVAFKQAMEGQP